MDKVLVKVVKLAGETGLLKPGSLVTLPEDTAKLWVSKGWAEYVIIVSVGAAVTLVLSAFDGDFGTYARHQIALIPWLIAVLCPTELTKPEVPIVPARSGGI